MTNLLIIGCGNPLRGDDGLAWFAVGPLKRHPGLEGAQLMCCHQLMPEMAEPISRAGRVIFIDARVRDNPGQPPGTLEVRKVEPKSSIPSALGHHLDPSELLDLAFQAYGKRPPAFVVSMVGEFFGYCDVLSSSVRSSLPQLVQRVVDLAHGSSQDGKEPGTKPECRSESTVAVRGSAA